MTDSEKLTKTPSDKNSELPDQLKGSKADGAQLVVPWTFILVGVLASSALLLTIFTGWRVFCQRKKFRDTSGKEDGALKDVESNQVKGQADESEVYQEIN